MKNLKTLILSLSLVLFITNACNESFTEVPAYGALSDESLANATGIDLLLTCLLYTSPSPRDRG